MFEFRFYSLRDEKLNCNQPNLDRNEPNLVLYNLNPESPRCPLLKKRDFDFQYSYYLTETNNGGIFSVYWSPSLNTSVAYTGAMGIFIRKCIITHFPNATEQSIVRIYLPNYPTPITKVTKAPFRIDCVKDLLLSLKDDYKIELHG